MTSLPPAADLRAEWDLAPDLRYLNHGGFGGVPRVVREAAAAIRAEVDANPTDFLTRTYQGRLELVRRELAAFLGADPDGLVLVANATAGVATALAALDLEAGDELLTTDHCYGAVWIALQRTAARAGATVRVANVPLDVDDPAEVVAAVMAAATVRTKVLVIDQVASASGFCFPVEPIVAAAHDRGIAVCVDAAHALAMLDVDVAAIDADFWVGNLHKWLCAPRAAAVVVAAERYRDALRPLVASHWFADGLLPAFDWTGTHDPAPVLAAPAALGFLAGLGWDQVRERQLALAGYGAAVVAQALGTRVPVRDAFASALRVAELPEPLTMERAAWVMERLLVAHRIEVPVMTMGGHGGLIRVSGAVYNEPAEYDALAEALPLVLRELTARRG